MNKLWVEQGCKDGQKEDSDSFGASRMLNPKDQAVDEEKPDTQCRFLWYRKNDQRDHAKFSQG